MEYSLAKDEGNWLGSRLSIAPTLVEVPEDVELERDMTLFDREVLLSERENMLFDRDTILELSDMMMTTTPTWLSFDELCLDLCTSHCRGKCQVQNHPPKKYPEPDEAASRFY